MTKEPPRDQDPASTPVVRRVTSAIDGAVDRVEGAVGAAAGRIEGAVVSTARRWEERPGARVRRLRRRAREPLPMLYARHPEARSANRRELGLKTIDVADIEGTAVGGPQQRGADFLPLKPFRSENWRGRWQRLRSAADRLVVLPPIEVVRYGDRYWVTDGHNRVASALYGGQLAIDAMVSQLGTPGATSAEAPETYSALVADGQELRAALRRSPPREEEDDAT